MMNGMMFIKNVTQNSGLVILFSMTVTDETSCDGQIKLARDSLNSLSWLLVMRPPVMLSRELHRLLQRRL